MSASLPKSSPSLSVATVPFPWMTTSTEPFCKIYHDRPSSPWLNTGVGCRDFSVNDKKKEGKKKVKREAIKFCCFLALWILMLFIPAENRVPRKSNFICWCFAISDRSSMTGDWRRAPLPTSRLMSIECYWKIVFDLKVDVGTKGTCIAKRKLISLHKERMLHRKWRSCRRWLKNVLCFLWESQMEKISSRAIMERSLWYPIKPYSKHTASPTTIKFYAFPNRNIFQ